MCVHCASCCDVYTAQSLRGEIEQTWTSLDIPLIGDEMTDATLNVVTNTHREAVALLKSMRARDADCVGVHIRRGDKIVVHDMARWRACVCECVSRSVRRRRHRVWRHTPTCVITCACKRDTCVVGCAQCEQAARDHSER
jgi:hypothetical protein